MDLNMIRHVTEIGDDGELGAIGAEGKANGIGGVVGNGESVDVNVADGEMLTSMNGFDTAEALTESLRKNALHCAHGRFCDVERRFPQGKHLRQAVTVIRVFVGDKDAIEMVDGFFNGTETSQGFALAESGVHEEAGMLGLEQSDIARATGRQDGNSQTDRSPRAKILRFLNLSNRANEFSE